MWKDFVFQLPLTKCCFFRGLVNAWFTKGIQEVVLIQQHQVRPHGLEVA